MRAALTVALLACAGAALAKPPTETAAAEPQRDPPEVRLARGRQAYDRGDFPRAIDELYPLLYPTVQLAADDEIAARKLLALAYFQQRAPAQAEEELNALLQIKPDFGLDRSIDPPNAIVFLDTIRKRNQKRLQEIAEQQRREQEEEDRRRREREEDERRRREARPIVVEKKVTEHWFVLNFVPFGVGQFQNGQRGKGLLFAGSQLALGGASLALWAVVEASRYGWQQQTPPGPTHDQRQLAVQLEVASVVLGALFWIDVGIGIVDSLIHYKPRVVVVPSVQPGGAGVSVQGVF